MLRWHRTVRCRPSAPTDADARGTVLGVLQPLRQQSGRIHDQAASATINLNQLKTAFANIYATMEAVDSYKSAALQSMWATVDELETEVAKARGDLERAKGSPAIDDGAGGAIGTSELALPAGLPPAAPAGSPTRS